MYTFAVYNIKGGVGKTSSAVNLAYLAAREGVKTLVWDLDPQGAASYYFRIKPKIKGGGKKLLHGRKTLDSVIKGTDFDNLDMIPADFSYRNMDLVLGGSDRPTMLLKKLLKPLRRQYDYIFLDCPPSISLVSENVFQAGDAMLIPTIPTVLSLRTLEQIMRFFRENITGDPTILPFFTMVDSRKSLHRLIVERPPTVITTGLSASIPYSSDVERMGLHRAPVGTFAPRSAAARSYEDLWNGIKATIP